MALEEQIRPSVACVLSPGESETFSGNAFLFRNDGRDQYWFTCHHVIMGLPDLVMRIERHGKTSISSASYIKEKSCPWRDIAVLKTSETNWADLRALNMGDPFSAKLSSDSKIILFGYIRDEKTGRIEPRLIPSDFSRHDHDAYYLNTTQCETVARDENDDEVVTQEWHVKVEEPVDIATYELHNGNHFLPGLSGAPVCYITPDLDVACLGMFSQIWYGPLRDAQKGVAIKFADLLEAAGSLIPLYPYADCLVVTVAATRDEIAYARRNYRATEGEPEWWLHMAQENFYDSHRDYWRPFGVGEDAEMRVVDLIDMSQTPEVCQLISDYLAEEDEIARIMTNFPGVIFILDPCSTNIESLSKVMDIANRAHWKASYLTICCEQRLAGRWFLTKIASVVKSKLREVASDPLCEERMESAWVAEDFNRHIKRLIRATVDIGAATWRANPSVQPRARLRNQLDTVVNFPHTRPTLS